MSWKLLSTKISSEPKLFSWTKMIAGFFLALRSRNLMMNTFLLINNVYEIFANNQVQSY